MLCGRAVGELVELFLDRAGERGNIVRGLSCQLSNHRHARGFGLLSSSISNSSRNRFRLEPVVEMEN